LFLITYEDILPILISVKIYEILIDSRLFVKQSLSKGTVTTISKPRITHIQKHTY